MICAFWSLQEVEELSVYFTQLKTWVDETIGTPRWERNRFWRNPKKKCCGQLREKKIQEFLLWWFFYSLLFINSLELIRELQESFQSSSTFQNQFIHNKKYPMFEPEWPLANSATMRIKPKYGYTMCSIIFTLFWNDFYTPSASTNLHTMVHTIDALGNCKHLWHSHIIT